MTLGGLFGRMFAPYGDGKRSVSMNVFVMSSFMGVFSTAAARFWFFCDPLGGVHGLDGLPQCAAR